MTTPSTHDHGMQQAALHSNQAVGGYSGFLSILIGLCSLPFLALRAVVDFFAPPSAAELLTRHQGANGHPAWPQSAITPTPLATTEQPLSPACEATPPHVTPTENTMKKIAVNDRPTVTMAKKTLRTGLSLQHGRVIISGRMADVCAELERLAAIEAASA